MLIGYSVKLVAVLVLFAYMWSVNKKRDRESASGIQLTEQETKEAIEAGMHDMTEIDNKGFRYILYGIWPFHLKLKEPIQKIGSFRHSSFAVSMSNNSSPCLPFTFMGRLSQNDSLCLEVLAPPVLTCQFQM